MRKGIDFDQFKKELETQKSTFKQRLDQETKSLQAYSDSNPDLMDAATKLAAQERKVGSIKYSRGRLAQIEAALRRLEDGRFGICTRCGNDIDIDRLRAKPHAKYCVKCKKITERQR